MQILPNTNFVRILATLVNNFVSIEYNTLKTFSYIVELLTTVLLKYLLILYQLSDFNVYLYIYIIKAKNEIAHFFIKFY